MKLNDLKKLSLEELRKLDEEVEEKMWNIDMIDVWQREDRERYEELIVISKAIRKEIKNREVQDNEN